MARVGDHAGEPGEAIAPERRLDDPALVLPHLILAGEQAITEYQTAGFRQAYALVIVGRVVRQDVLGVIGVVEEVESLGAHGELDHIAELAGRVGEHGQPVEPELAQQARHREQRRPGVVASAAV